MSAESRRFTLGSGPECCGKCADACLAKVALIFAPGAAWVMLADGVQHWGMRGGSAACGKKIQAAEAR